MCRISYRKLTQIDKQSHNSAFSTLPHGDHAHCEHAQKELDGSLFNDIFFDDLDSRSKVKFQGQTGSQLNLGSYLKTYWTHRLHTRYQGTTQ